MKSRYNIFIKSLKRVQSKEIKNKKIKFENKLKDTYIE